MLGQPDFFSQDVRIVGSCWWVPKVKVAVWLSWSILILLGEAEKTFLQRVIVMGQPLSQGLEKLPCNLVTCFSTSYLVCCGNEVVITMIFVQGSFKTILVTCNQIISN